MFALNILADKNEGHEQELDDVGNKKQEGKRIGVKGVGKSLLYKHPAKDDC